VVAEGAESRRDETDEGAEMNDDINDVERRKRQQEAFQKIVEAGQVPPVMPQPERLKYPWVLTEKDATLLRSIKIDPDK
jgi:hypothetical protein